MRLILGMAVTTLVWACSSTPPRGSKEAETITVSDAVEDTADIEDGAEDTVEDPDDVSSETADDVDPDAPESDTDDVDDPTSDPGEDVDAGPIDSCTLVVPKYAFGVGPGTLPPFGQPPGGVALAIHDVITPFPSSLERIALIQAGEPAGIQSMELRVFERSGDVFKLEAKYTFDFDTTAAGEQEIVFDPPIVVPSYRYLGLFDPAGIRVGQTASMDQVWFGAPAADVSDVKGSLIELAGKQGTLAWRAEFVDIGPCKHGGTCGVVGDGYSCTCLPAYGGADCSTISDACQSEALNDCDELAECVSEGGAKFHCVCPQGYEGDGAICNDLDECNSAAGFPCSENAECTNVPGSHECDCWPGFEGDGVTCDDIDECLGDTDCAEAADCNDLPGSYECVCQAGWQGDGNTCEDVDECALDPDAVGVDCGDSAVCANTEGGFECACKPGYVKDGFFCADVDECLDDSLNQCDDNALCYNESGTYACECSDGYVGDGTDCCGAPFATGETCEDALPICELPFEDSRLSISNINDYGAGIKQCNSGVAGNVGGASPDLVYAFETELDKPITISATGDFAIAIYVVADCGPISQCIPDCTILGSSCVAADSAEAGETAFIDTVLMGGFTWYIVVDGEGSMVSLSGSYTINVQ